MNLLVSFVKFFIPFAALFGSVVIWVLSPPYEIIHLGLLLSLIESALLLYYIFTSRGENGNILDQFNAEYYISLPISKFELIRKELTFLFTSKIDYVVTYIVIAVSVFLLAIPVTTIINAVAISLVYILTQIFLLGIYIRIRQSFLTKSFLMNVFNIQVILYFIAIASDSAILPWYFSIGNYNISHLVFGISLSHIILMTFTSFTFVYLTKRSND